MQADVIIQARMNSSRMPGKVIRKIKGRPMISYLAERVRLIRHVDHIVLATTNNPSDDPLAHIAEKEGLIVYRGSKNDVLDRYFQSAELYDFKHIIRITGDCPLLQPAICERLIKIYFQSGCDYAYTGQSFAEGLDCEIFSRRALNQAWKLARLQSEREHVTLYFRNHPDMFRMMKIDNETDDSRFRITVDEHDDFIVIQKIYENLYDRCQPYITMADIKEFLNSRQDIYALNQSIVRNEGLIKSLQQDT